MLADPWANNTLNNQGGVGGGSLQIYAKVTPEREKDVMSGSQSPNPSMKGTPREFNNKDEALIKTVSFFK